MATESSLVSGIAGRYATALFQLARDAKALDQVEADLNRIGAMLDGSADLVRLVRSPLFGADAQMRAMAALLAHAAIGDLVCRFIGVLARNRRLFALADIMRDFRLLLARHRGETVAEVVAAVPLTAEQLYAIRAALSSAVGREIIVRDRVDPTLIGGLVVKLGSKMFDSSLKSKLDNLAVAMKGVS